MLIEILKWFCIVYLSIGLFLYLVTFRKYKNDTEETKNLLDEMDERWALTFGYVVLLWPDAIIHSIFGED